jgi:hypothetical protein
MTRRLCCSGLALLLTALFPLAAQEGDFGFGFGGEEAGAPAKAGGAQFGAALHGEIAASMTGFFDDFVKGPEHTNLEDIFSARLDFSAEAALAEGIVKLRLRPGANPLSLDEAYIRVFFGDFDVEGGLRKLTWGKADSFGPLDVVNPLDSSGVYPEMADSADLMDLKIPRPLIHATWRLGEFSKLEALFVPGFEPHRPPSGRWAPAPVPAGITIQPPGASTISSVKYAQGGLRFTTTLAGAADIGAQYYYGRLPQPAVTLSMAPTPTMNLDYNPYHQIGVDYAQVLYGFNLRAELAANITEDLKGEDPAVYNPSLAWSLGFDRDLFLGINLNLQVNESIRLMNGGVGSADYMSPNFDTEGGTGRSATRVTGILSRKFLRDELEVRAAAVWGVEDGDFALMPALIWSRDALSLSAALGFFGGNREGQLGQYRDKGFVKIRLGYLF